MRLRTELTAALEAVVRPRDELVILQSSLFHLASSAGGLKWEALASVRALADAGHTLALPAFTFSYVRDGCYHHQHTVSGSGQLADWVLELPEARRTPHPVYSYVVLGPRREDLLACRRDAAFGEGTVFEFFEADDARIVLAGASWQTLTQVHRYEELFGVPYRERMHIEGLADFGDGGVPAAVDMFVRDVTLDSVLNFTPVIDELRRAGAIDRAEVGRGAVEATSCQAVRAACHRVIGADSYALVERPRIIEHRVATRALAPVCVAVVGAQNVDTLAGAVRHVGEGLLGGRQLTVHAPPFGQHARELLDPDSPLRTLDAHCVVFADRLEDIFEADDLELLDAAPDLERLDSHLDLLARYAATVTCPIVVLVFADLRARATAPVGVLPSRTCQVAEHGNARLAALAAEHSHMHLLDTGALAAAFAGPVLDDRLWHVGRLPFAQPFCRHLAERVWGLTLAAGGSASRLIALDLDGTLWGGVLGEDNVAGIALGGDHPGNAFVHFQRALRQLRQSGVALALCSKNDADQALRVLREHPDMVLREQDLAGWRIDWQPKSDNLAALAAELGIALEHILFVDDNPVEREAIRQHLPAVKVLDLPPDPARYADALAACPYLARLSVTDEDRQRTERYQARGALERERQSFADVESFYASLDMALAFAPLSAANAPRAEQLSQKTNQFNMTTRRHRRGDLERLADAKDAEVALIRLGDRFVAREHVGLLVLRYDADEPRIAEIDTFLLSCRVLGHGVERGVLSWIAERARAHGMTRLLGTIVETARNTPCRDVYRLAGFQPSQLDGTWMLDLETEAVACPAWLTIDAEPTLKRA